MDQIFVTLMLSVAIQLAVMSALVQWDILGVASIAVCKKCSGAHNANNHPSFRLQRWRSSSL